MAEVNVRLQRFFTQHPTVTEHFQTVEIWHPNVGALRFVANRYVDKQFGIEADSNRDAGTTQTFQPLTMEVSRPEQNEIPDARITCRLGRVGSEVRRYLKQIRDFGYMRQAEFIYREYISDDMTQPVKIYRLWVSRLNMSANNVSIQAEDDNPLNLNISRIYRYEDFPGLETT